MEKKTFDKFQCTLNKLIFSDTELFDFRALFTICPTRFKTSVYYRSRNVGNLNIINNFTSGGKFNSATSRFEESDF
jgi:hypothetical protein